MLKRIKSAGLSARIDLRGVILLSSLLILVVTLLISLFVAWQVQRQALLENAQQSSRAYALKVASGVDDFIYGAHRRLGYSAALIGDALTDDRLLTEESHRLLDQDASFGAVIIINAAGKILKATPERLGLLGRVTHADGSEEALREQRPMVSNVFEATSGGQVVFITMPVRDKGGQYRGLIGGAINVRKQGTLHTLASDHFNRDGTRTYIVDRVGRIIHHPDPARVGTLVDKALMDYFAQSESSGPLLLQTSEGNSVIAGFARVPLSGWLVVSERTRASTLVALEPLIWKMFLSIIPFAIAIVVAIWWLAHLISRPLRLLARGVAGPDTRENIERIRGVLTWYREAFSIKQELLKGMATMQDTIRRLNTQAHTDPLTGLANRRAKREALRKMEAAGQPFAVVVLDIDHFKSINDTWGHEAGDATLCHLARLLEACSREGDIVCRIGGEEFMLLLPATPLVEAAKVGERVRKRVAGSAVDGVGTITVSLGIAGWPVSGRKPADVVKQADRLMYRAKQAGRNRLYVDTP